MNENQAISEGKLSLDGQLTEYIQTSFSAEAMFDRDMLYIVASKRWIEINSLSDREFTGISHYELFPTIPERWKEIHRRCLAGETLREDEDSYVREDGSIQWVRWEVRPWLTANKVVGGIVMFSEDITERKQAEIELEKYNHHLEALNGRWALVERAAAIGVWDWDIKTGKLTWSEEFYKLFGLDSSAVEANFDTWTASLFPEDIAKATEQINDAVLHHRALYNEYRIILPSGEIRWIAAHGDTTYDNLNEPIRMLGICFDITQRKQADLDLAKSMRQIEEKELAKSRFLTAAGHDLRQPLAAANLFIDALKFSKPNSEQKIIIDRLDLAMSNFNVLLDTLLNVSKLDAGAITPRITEISLVEVFSWLEQSFTPMCAEKQLKLKFHFPLSSSLAVRTDIGLLKSILLNLVSNAIQYTSQGGILISARQRGETILLQIWDSGIGIQEENIEKIFDDFYQINNPHRDRTQGLGLGLSIAQRSLALLDGKIACHSKFGQGSVFGFNLPKYSNPSEEVCISISSISDEIESISQFVKGKRFVIVEDDALVSEALTKTLSLMGGVVESYFDADKALQESNVEKADCFIVDYMLPGDVDGINLLLRLHQKIHKPVCAVMMSGNTSTQFIQKTKFFNWPIVHKPVDIAQLVFQLRKQLAN